MKQRRFLGLFAFLGLFGVLAVGCISDETRGWGAPVKQDDTQIVSSTKGKLDGIDIRTDPTPAWTGTLPAPLGPDDTRLQAQSLAATDTVFQGDLLHIGSEIIRVRSLRVNGVEREMQLDRGFAGTTATSHVVGAEIEAFRRPWRFPDDWHIREGSARSLGGVYGQPIVDADGTLYLGDYKGWVYAFRPEDVNLDAAGDNDEPKVGLSDLGETLIGGVALDPESGLLYAAAGNKLFAVSTDKLKAALSAGGGVIEPEFGFAFEAGDEMWAPPLILDGTVLVTSLDGHLYRLDGATGEVQWSFDAGPGLMTAPVVTNGLVLAGGFDNTLFAVDVTSGELAWSFEVDNWIFSSPRVEDGTVFFGDFDSNLYALDAETGEQQWSLSLDRGPIRAAVAIVDDVVVVGSDDGWLIGVDREAQSRIWETELGTDIRANLVVEDGEVLLSPHDCVTPPGTEVETYYYAVDPATGTLKGDEVVC